MIQIVSMYMIPITKLTSEATPLEVPKKRWLNLGKVFSI